MHINIFSIIILFWIFILFIISIFTHFTFLYISFGFCLLLAIRISFRKPDYLTAFTLGFKIAFWAYIANILIGIVIFRSISICPTVLITGLLIIPVISGATSALFNIFPEVQTDKNKPVLFKGHDKT